MTDLSWNDSLQLTLTNRGTHQVGNVFLRLVERLVVPLRIESSRLERPYYQDCLIDTACPLPLLFPFEKWRRFPQAIDWLAPELEAQLPLELRGSAGAGGERIEYRFGKICVRPCDAGYQSAYPRTWQLAAFARDETMIGLPLIGLGGGLLNVLPLYLNLFHQQGRLG
jgi:hypothetical protein